MRKYPIRRTPVVNLVGTVLKPTISSTTVFGVRAWKCEGYCFEAYGWSAIDAYSTWAGKLEEAWKKLEH